METLKKINSLILETKQKLNESETKGQEVSYFFHLSNLERVKLMLEEGINIKDIYKEAEKLGEEKGDWTMENIVSDLL